MIVLRQKQFSSYLQSGIVVEDKDQIKYLRKLDYPRFYVDYLEKVNPIISKSGLDDDRILFARPMDYDSYGTETSPKFPGDEDFGPYSEIKGGKRYIGLFYKDPSLSEEFGYSETSCILWYCIDDGNWYLKERSRLFSKAFKLIPDIKNFLLNWYSEEKQISESIKRL